MGPRAGLNGCGICRPHRDSISGYFFTARRDIAFPLQVQEVSTFVFLGTTVGTGGRGRKQVICTIKLQRSGHDKRNILYIQEVKAQYHAK